MGMRKRIIVIALLLVNTFCFAQDHLYSQFFNAPIYLNPALNGQFEGKLRMSMIYRNQYTTIPGNFNYISAAIDYNIPKFGGGFGLMFTRSSEGLAYLKNN
ncbi:MAG: type IX secretion system membrane protein PorP/SprF, partial [Sphingobacteriales bacterium]